jgi:hypothetical protein
MSRKIAPEMPRLRWNGEMRPYSRVGTVTVVARVGLSERSIVIDGTFPIAMGVAQRIATEGFWSETGDGDPVFVPPHEIAWVKVPRPRPSPPRRAGGGR